MLGRELIERDAVAKTRPSLRMRRRGQKTGVRIVAGRQIRMRESGQHREVIAELFDDFQIRRKLVIFARFFGKKAAGCMPSGVQMQTIRRGALAAARHHPLRSEDVEPRECRR